MDINEITGAKINRHPWELSRTECILKEWLPYIRQMPQDSRFINIGAGDIFFDRHILNACKKHCLYAIDIGYATEKVDLIRNKDERILLYDSLDKVDEMADYGIMMDSLEYMPDPAKTIKELLSKIKPGGYVFFTLPAFQWLYSEHDIIVKNLRRYSKNDIASLIHQMDGISIVDSRYFYFSLFIVRCIQKYAHLKIDPEHKVTTGWPYGRRHPLTRISRYALDLDYSVGKFFAKIGISTPGLSLMVICRKDRNRE